MEQNDVTLALCKFNASCLLAMHAMRLAGNHAFRRSAPAVWNSLPKAAIGGDSVAVFKSRLKTFLFSQAFSSFSAH